jgi:hypothetical protein
LYKQTLFTTYPHYPLPLAREGGNVLKRGQSPPLFVPPPLLFKERGIKGVRLINNSILRTALKI